MNEKTKMVTAFVCGAALSGGIVAFAGQYTATDNPYPIQLNGSEVYLEGYNINDSTYFKLRDISDVVGGFDVDFADDTILLSKNGYSYNSAVDTSNATLEEQNALKKALQYLEYSAFSYSGLISQLEFEEFSTEAATYAVDNCGADWYEQAARKAQSYMEYSAYSKSGLISQLEYEGFTTEQAEYGAASVGY